MDRTTAAPYLPEMSTQKSRKACPICGRPADAKHAPFCSPRCADVDLHRWLSGSYAIPAAEEDDSKKAEARRPAKDEE